ncbi:alpha/beta hydrolase [Rhizobium leguminosarum bv. viciae]|nr:alpha/beta hydrolase [Rhizobium leguminosarum bv. viciae]
MSRENVNVVLVHGAWADGSSWSKIIQPLAAEGLTVVAAPLPLTSFSDDVAALDRALERLTGPVVLVGHAYAGAVIAATGEEKVKGLVYIAALAPDEGETVADIFYRGTPHPQAPKLSPDNHGLIYLPEEAFASAFAQNATDEEQAVLAAVQRPISPACITVPVSRPLWKDRSAWFPGRRTGPDDRCRQPALHGRADAGASALSRRRPHADRYGACRRARHRQGGGRHSSGGLNSAVKTWDEEELRCTDRR